MQSRIAKGLFSMTDFQAWFATFAADLEAQGANVVGPYFYPHRRAEPFPCKKPNVLLYEHAAIEHNLTAAECFVIGDFPDDVRATRNLGARMPRSYRLDEGPACYQQRYRTQLSSLTRLPSVRLDIGLWHGGRGGYGD